MRWIESTNGERMPGRREYLQLLEKAKRAAEAGIDAFNRVHHPYRDEATVIFLTNAWELLAKAVLIKKQQSIRRDKRGNTIAAESAVFKLCHIIGYESAGVVSDGEAREMLEVAAGLQSDVLAWLGKQHPKLLKR